MRKNNLPGCTVMLLSALCLGGAMAQEDDAIPDYREETLSGDWGGLRRDWYRQGLAVEAGYKWDMLKVTSGGQARGGRPMEHLDLKAKLDLESMLGWEATTAYFNYIHDAGGKLNRDYLGSQLASSNIEVTVSTGRLFHAWVEKGFWGNRLSLLAGLYPIDSEFQVLDSAGVFVQPPYGAMADIALTRGPSIFNNSAFGLRAKWRSADATVYFQGAVLDGIPGDPRHPKATHVRFDKGDGAMQIVELGYAPREKGHLFEPASPEKGVPTTPELKAHEAREAYEKYAFGLWRYTTRVDDLMDIDDAGVPMQRRSQGWYALLERSLWQWAGGDLSAFFRTGVTDGNSIAIRRATNLGLVMRGPLPNREKDQFGAAHTRGTLGGKFRESQELAGIGTVKAESAVEITYLVQVNKWLAVQPVWQRYRDPGATSGVSSATVLGLRLGVAL
ncbi:carbohydrate porin [Denitratisoma oestradiolicum]|nr:carbohydrate porin [Denitratisoma oestradiolicum]TWO81060.1 hypothetical protein CBW56_05470 [Denitratisoma oestradiolicum]